MRDDIKVYGGYAAAKCGMLCGTVEVTSACFQHCRNCDSWRDHVSGRQWGEWTLHGLQELTTQALAFPWFRHLTLTGGDPQAWEPLHEYFRWLLDGRFFEQFPRFRLQMTTALARPIADPLLFRAAVSRIRVSLDAATPEVYTAMRGDSENTPEAIVERLVQLGHADVSTLTTVTEANIHEVPAIIQMLARRLGSNGIRKAMFLAAIDHRAEHGLDFWVAWKRFAKMAWPIETSFSDDLVATRDFCGSPPAADVRCYVPLMSFYVKANGDFYPCCLVGGEAVQTRVGMCLGSFMDATLLDIWNSTTAEYRYATTPCCRDLCQFKQLTLNRAATLAEKTTLSMP